MQKCPSWLSFQLSANYISWISVFGAKVRREVLCAGTRSETLKIEPVGCKRSGAACVWLLKFQFPLRIWRVERTCKIVAMHTWNCYGPVCIAISYGLHDRGLGVRVPAGWRICSSAQLRPVLGSTQPPSQWLPVLFPRR
jgi:hypothetical protein